MSARPRTRIFKTREEVAGAELVPAHYRRLLGWVYGPGADHESLWDDAYIRELEPALSSISPRQSVVIRARLLGVRPARIAYLLAVTLERIRQLEGQALRRIRLRSGLKVIPKLREQLCEYPARPKPGPLLLPTKTCAHCGQPQDKSVRFPPCPIRIARLMQLR